MLRGGWDGSPPHITTTVAGDSSSSCPQQAVVCVVIQFFFLLLFLGLLLTAEGMINFCNWGPLGNRGPSGIDGMYPVEKPPPEAFTN